MVGFKQIDDYVGVTAPIILLAIICLPSHTRGQEEPAGEQPLSLLVRGIVVDELGEPVAGAKIETLAFEKDDQRQTISLGNGAFLLRLPAEGHSGQTILATDAEGELAGYISQYAYTTDNRTPLRIVLRPWKNTTLRVTDSQEQPVVEATVVLIASDQELMKTETDQEGNASLRFPADAKVDWIIAYKAGSGFDYYENYNAWPTQDRLQVPERFELKLAGAVSAIIEVRDSDDNPVPNIMVAPWLIETEGKITRLNMSGLGIQRTDEDGQALFDWLPNNLKGRINFLIQDEKYYCATNPIYVLNTEEVVTRTARVQRVATVQGTVRHADGSPAPGIRLQGEGRGATNMYFRGYTRTDAQGKYSIDIYPNQETILAVADDRYAAASKTDIDLKPAEELNDVDFTLGFGTLIHGKLTLGNERELQAGQTATLIEKAGDKANLVRWFETKNSGEYRFRVGPGTYTLRLADSNQIAITVTNQEAIVHDGHIDRLPRGELSGVVQNNEGHALSNAEILGESIASPGHAGFKTRTNDDGMFSCERWNDKMMVYAFDAQQKQAGFKLIEESDKHVSISCEPAGSLSGTVVDSQGEPVAKRRVALHMSLIDGGGANFNIMTETDANGTYSFPAIAVGMQGEVFAPLLFGPGQTIEFKMTKTEDLMLTPIVN